MVVLHRLNPAYNENFNFCRRPVLVVLSDPFRGMGERRNPAETNRRTILPRSGSEVKNGSGAKDGALERLRCETIQKKVS